MRSTLRSLVLMALATGALAMNVPAVCADASVTPPAHYSVTTTLIGTLLDDPAAAAVLKNLAKIQAEFDKLPAKV